MSQDQNAAISSIYYPSVVTFCDDLGQEHTNNDDEHPFMDSGNAFPLTDTAATSPRNSSSNFESHHTSPSFLCESELDGDAYFGCDRKDLQVETSISEVFQPFNQKTSLLHNMNDDCESWMNRMIRPSRFLKPDCFISSEHASFPTEFASTKPDQKPSTLLAPCQSDNIRTNALYGICYKKIQKDISSGVTNAATNTNPDPNADSNLDAVNDVPSLISNEEWEAWRKSIEQTERRCHHENFLERRLEEPEWIFEAFESHQSQNQSSQDDLQDLVSEGEESTNHHQNQRRRRRRRRQNSRRHQWSLGRRPILEWRFSIAHKSRTFGKMFLSLIRKGGAVFSPVHVQNSFNTSGRPSTVILFNDFEGSENSEVTAYWSTGTAIGSDLSL